jgi:hypothetical protein
MRDVVEACFFYAAVNCSPRSSSKTDRGRLQVGSPHEKEIRSSKPPSTGTSGRSGKISTTSTDHTAGSQGRLRKNGYCRRAQARP